MYFRSKFNSNLKVSKNLTNSEVQSEVGLFHVSSASNIVLH